jgi:uncharacterized protein YhaN
MKLSRFTLDGFAQIDHLEIDFSDAEPNLIIGPNESGKSQLMRALYGTFFPLDQAELSVPWVGEGEMHGVLEFIDDEERKVTLTRDLRSDHVTVSVGRDDPWDSVVRPVKSGDRFQTQLDHWLGFRSPKLFTSTSFVRQTDMMAAELNGISGQVKQIITGTGDADYDKVLKNLDKKLDELRRKPNGKAKRLEITEQELQDCRTAYAQAVADHEAFSRLENDLSSVETSLAADRGEQSRLRLQLATASQLVRAEKELADLQIGFSRADDVRNARLKLQEKLQSAQEVQRQLSKYAGTTEVGLNELDRNVESAQTAVRQLEKQTSSISNTDLCALDGAVTEAQQALAGSTWPESVTILDLTEVDHAAQAEAQRVEEGPAARIPAPFMWVAIAIALISLVPALLVSPIFFLLTVVAGGVGAYLYGAGRSSVRSDKSAAGESEQRRRELLQRIGVKTVSEARARWEEHEHAREVWNHTLRSREDALHGLGVGTTEQALHLWQQLEGARLLLGRAEKARNDELSRLGATTIADAISACRAYIRASGDVTAYESTLAGYEDAAEGEWKGIGHELHAKQLGVEQLLENSPALAALDGPSRAEHLTKLDQRTSALDGLIAELTKREGELRINLGIQQNTPHDDVAVLVLQAQALEERLRLIRQEVAAYRMAKDVLTAAISKFRDHCLGPVMQHSSALLASVTGGRYTVIELAAQDLTPSVYGPACPGPEPIDPHRLSRGVQDQMYFSIRVALARAITRGRPLPLVLDDPFVNFDQERLARVLAMLNDLAAGRVAQQTQILIFTCDPRYAAWVTPRRVLPAPAVVAAYRSIA